MNGKELIDKLNNGGRIYGTAIISDSPLWPQVVKETGVDFVFIDTEHIPLNRETVSQMCQQYRILGVPPMVRIPSADPIEACKILDSGAAGILAPYIESVEEVRKLVGATKFRPLKGERLEAILRDQDQMDARLKKYLEERNTGTFLFINIESRKGVENLKDLLSVPGLEGVIIGPHDLSCSLGVPEDYDSPIFQDFIKNIVITVRKHGLHVGIHFPDFPEKQIALAKLGLNIILHSWDISLFGKALKNDITTIRKALGEETDKAEFQSKNI